MRGIIITCVLLFLILSALGQTQRFDCPCKNGKIVNYFHSTEVARKPGAEIQSKNSTVYIMLEGEVVGIDTVKNDIRVYIKSGNFFFSFHGLASVNVSKGQAVSKGQQPGKLLAQENLFLIMSFKDDLVEPTDYLRCGQIKKYL
jgi:hypothetical protein